LQQAFVAGGGNLGDLLLFLANLNAAGYAGSLDRLMPTPYLAEAQTALLSSFDFGNSLFSCPTPAGDGHGLFGEGNCYWLLPAAHTASYASNNGFAGFNEKAGGLTGGVQGALAPNWYLDVGLGYERSSIGGDFFSANGDIFRGGAALKYIRDRWLVAGSVSGSVARYDTSRYGIPIGGTATANADTTTLDLRLRFAYAFGNETFYVKPLVDFDAVGLWRGAINENGAGALNLQVQSQNDWLASAAPAVEFGNQWQTGHDIWRPYVRAGMRFLSEKNLNATADFTGAPAGVSPFTITAPLDQVLAEVSAGFDFWRGKRYSLRVAYDGRFGAHTSSNGGEVKLRASF